MHLGLNLHLGKYIMRMYVLSSKDGLAFIKKTC